MQVTLHLLSHLNQLHITGAPDKLLGAWDKILFLSSEISSSDFAHVPYGDPKDKLVVAVLEVFHNKHR